MDKTRVVASCGAFWTTFLLSGFCVEFMRIDAGPLKSAPSIGKSNGRSVQYDQPSRLYRAPSPYSAKTSATHSFPAAPASSPAQNADRHTGADCPFGSCDTSGAPNFARGTDAGVAVNPRAARIIFANPYNSGGGPLLTVPVKRLSRRLKADTSRQDLTSVKQTTPASPATKSRAEDILNKLTYSNARTTALLRKVFGW